MPVFCFIQESAEINIQFSKPTDICFRMTWDFQTSQDGMNPYFTKDTLDLWSAVQSCCDVY